MARCALILLVAVLTACTSADEKLAGNLSRSEIERAAALRTPKLPANLPAACTAKMDRSYPAKGTPWVITQKRWNIYADDRDAKARSCAGWWLTYRGNMEAGTK